MGSLTVVQLLQGHRAELLECGVENVTIVGSVARNTSSPDSDVDLLVNLTGPDTGFARFRRLDELQSRLSQILGCSVDLIEEGALSPRVRREIYKDRVVAF